MDSDQGPVVFIQLRTQTSTESLSDTEFNLKTTAAGARINAYRRAQEAAALRAPYVISAAARLSIIPEDGHVHHNQTNNLSEIPTTSSSPSDDNFPLVHPGRLIPLSLEAQAEINNSYLSDSASDTTARPSGEAESAAIGSTVSLTTQFAIKQADGSYKDLTGDVAIKQPDGSYKDVISELCIKQPDGSYKDLHDNAPWTYQDSGISQLFGSQEQAPPEIAPWLYQDDGSAQPSSTKYQTPPSNLGRVNRTRRASRIVPSKTRYANENIEDFQLADKIRRRSSIPEPITPRPRTSSLTNLSIFTPSPRSATRLRKISSKLSFSNLRKPTSTFDSSSESESSTQVGTAFPCATAKRGSDSSHSTIGGTPYEEHIFGLAPATDLAEDNDLTDDTNPVEDVDTFRKRRSLRPLSILTKAHHPFDPLSAMEAIMEAPVIKVNDAAMTDYDSHRSAETVTPTPRVSSHGRPDIAANHQNTATASSLKTTRAKLHSDAATLFNSPPPLLSDHPINRPSENAFEIKTDYLLMSTSTPAPLIKALAKDMYQLSSKTVGFVDDVRKKKSYRNLGGLLARSAPPSQLAFGSELSPIVAAKNAALARSPDSLAPTTPSSVALTFDSYESRGKRLRKISTIFTKSSKASNSPMASPTMSQNSGSLIKVKEFQPNVEDMSGKATKEILKLFKRKQQASGTQEKSTKEEHEYLDHFIRNHLAYHLKDYKPGEWPHYPPHPNNSDRAWDHANLRCQTCILGFCSCCGKACCAYQAMTLRLSLFSKESEDNNGLKEMLAGLFHDTKLRPNPKEDTKDLKDALDALFPSSHGLILGGETQTFLQCTECKKMTCPKCCGICPIDGCHDTLCRKCKGVDPWSPSHDIDQKLDQTTLTLTTQGIASRTVKMRTYDDTFSATKIYPGKGKLYVRGDSKIFRFQNGKTESLFLQRKNPRRIAWTTLYRRMHKKGISEEVAKKRTRRTVKHQRAIVGASLDVIKERRTQRPEARTAARQAAIKEGKEKKAAAESARKAEKAKTASKAASGQARGGIASKQGAKGAAPKVKATTR